MWKHCINCTLLFCVSQCVFFISSFCFFFILCVLFVLIIALKESSSVSTLYSVLLVAWMTINSTLDNEELHWWQAEKNKPRSPESWVWWGVMIFIYHCTFHQLTYYYLKKLTKQIVAYLQIQQMQRNIITHLNVSLFPPVSPVFPLLLPWFLSPLEKKTIFTLSDLIFVIQSLSILSLYCP